MAIEEAKGEIILLGDFNAHYPMWGGRYVVSEEQVEHLLAETDARGLVLATPKGELTLDEADSILYTIPVLIIPKGRLYSTMRL